MNTSRGYHRVSGLMLVGLLAAGSIAAEPDQKDLRYSDQYERSVLDLWTVKADKPAPLVVYFHGGGFKKGDKKQFHRSSFVQKYHPKGVAFATVNYPFLEHTGNDYVAILKHTAQAIRFFETNAEKYNIDAQCISVTGSSAGALISGYLGHGSDLPICSVFAYQQPMGTAPLILPVLRKDGPPILLFNSSGPNDFVHHPDNASAVEKRCAQLGVYAKAYGSKASGLTEVPQGESIHDLVMKMFFKTWKRPYPNEEK